MGLPFRSLDEETVCVSIVVSRRLVDGEYSIFTTKSSHLKGKCRVVGRALRWTVSNVKFPSYRREELATRRSLWN